MKEVKLTVYLEDDEIAEDLIEAMFLFCLTNNITNKIITARQWAESKHDETRET
jgi:hypothetical protein